MSVAQNFVARAVVRIALNEANLDLETRDIFGQ